jgi:hypothetical protein
MNVVLMKKGDDGKFLGDCEEASAGTACQVTWDEMHAALKKDGIPNDLEDPIAGNPAWFKAAIESLESVRDGMVRRWRCDEIGLGAILKGKGTPGRVICLMHAPDSPVLSQHWVVWNGIASDGKHLFFWGDSETPRRYSPNKVIEFVTKGDLPFAPNCVFEVVPVDKKLPWYRRIFYWLGLKK